MQTGEHQLQVEEYNAGTRLDSFLSDAQIHLTRSAAKNLILENQVKVNGKIAKPSLVLKPGDLILINLPAPIASDVLAENIPLDIVYEDEDLVVVNKPAGLVVHPAIGNPTGTLVNALLAHCKNLSGIGGELKPGIVHRLDKGTSGVMVAAKNDVTHLALSRQFARRAVEKTYLAFVYGFFKAETGKFDTAIGRAKFERKKMSSRTRKAKEALTEWKLREAFSKKVSLMEVKLHTGRTHQIRVHFAESSHALLGDVTYGGEGGSKRLPKGPWRDAAEKLDRPALHAWRLSFTHPSTKKKMKFEAKLPKDLVALQKEFHKLTELE